MFAVVPATAGVAVWLTAPQAVGYVADDRSVFLKQPESWVELTDWRGDNGLNPLIIGDVIGKSPCAGKGAACALDLVAGAVEIAPVVAMDVGKAEVCASRARLTIKPLQGEAIEIDPCVFVWKWGAVIDTTASGLQLVPAKRQENRLWTQRLYAPLPKAPKAPKAPKVVEASSGKERDLPASQAAPAGAFAPRFDPPDQIAPSAPSLTPSVTLRAPHAPSAREDAAPLRNDAAQ